MSRPGRLEPEFPLRRPELAAVLAFGAGRMGLGTLAARLVELEWPAQDAVDLAELAATLRPWRRPGRRGRR